MVEESELAFLEANRRVRKGERAAPDPAERSTRRSRSRKTRGGLTAFVVGWVAVLGLLAGLVTLARQGAEERGGQPAEIIGPGDDYQILTDAYLKCTTRVREFLLDATPEGRSRLVHNPDETMGRMVRLGSADLRIDEEEEGEWKRFLPLSIGGERVYEGVYELEDGRRAEFVFLKGGDGDWKIDWSNLVRYSDHRWSRFLGGDTLPTGDFRLLARRRAGPLGAVGDVTSIVLYAPDPWDPGKVSARSPEVEIEAGSREAVMLGRAFRAREEGRGAFGSELQKEDPPAMIRVRVKLRRHEAEGDEKPRFELVELFACHWMSVDLPGFEIDEE